MRFQAEVEPVAGVLRVFDRNMVPGVDPYIFSATVVYSENGKTVELKGVTSTTVPFIRLRGIVCYAMFIRGVNTIKWTRKKDGKNHTVIMDTKKYAKADS